MFDFIGAHFKGSVQKRGDKHLFIVKTSEEKAIIGAMIMNVDFWNKCWISSNHQGVHTFNVRQEETE